MKRKILFVTPYPDSADAARAMSPEGFELVVASAGSPQYEQALASSHYLVGFVSSQVRTELFERAPNLQLVQLLSAGYDDVDLDAARASGVPVANNGGANSVAVSEHTLMLMLAVSRQVVWQHASVTAGHWRGNKAPRLFELRTKTLGIVGIGAIGKKVARLAQAFGMQVIYYDTGRLTEADEDALDVRFRLKSELLRAADYVSLHVPLNDATRHMIGAAELRLMKDTAFLINTSRGPVVDESALHEALAARRIAGAGLDVLGQEPPPPDHPLLSLDNVILTPHVAGPTFESHTARLRNAFDNVQRVARGDSPRWVLPELVGR